MILCLKALLLYAVSLGCYRGGDGSFHSKLAQAVNHEPAPRGEAHGCYADEYITSNAQKTNFEI